MTTIATPAIHPSTGPRGGALLGLRNLLRKDTREWMHGQRAVVVLVLSTLVYVLAAANARINQWVIANLPAGQGEVPPPLLSLNPMDNMLQALGTQFYILAAIFATISLVIAERESGTLAWTLSKPVSRTAFLVSKWLAATILLWLAAVVAPIAITSAMVTVLYGLPDLGAIAIISAGLVAVIALYAAVSIAAATVIPSQAGVAAVGLAVFVVPSILATAYPPLTAFLPTSIGGWAFAAALGGPTPIATPIVWLATIGVLLVVARRRLELMEL